MTDDSCEIPRKQLVSVYLLALDAGHEEAVDWIRHAVDRAGQAGFKVADG